MSVGAATATPREAGKGSRIGQHSRREEDLRGGGLHRLYDGATEDGASPAEVIRCLRRP
jgi:hypothetical protein